MDKDRGSRLGWKSGWILASDRSAIGFAVVAMGASAFVTQVTLMRELLGSLAGNELVLGIVLGSWMLLMGFGASVGRAAVIRDLPRTLSAGLAAIALLPIAAVFALRSLWHLVFVRGVVPGIPETVVACLVLLAPYCLVAGGLLTLACRLMPARIDSEGVGRVYYLDSVGGIVGGVFFGAVLVWWFDPFGILYWPAVLCLTSGCVVAWRWKRTVAAAVSAVCLAALVVVAVMVDLDACSTRLQHPGQMVVFHGHSAYGRLVVTRLASQYNFIENGVRLFSTRNIGDVEETVHYAMAQRPHARRVLLISGGISGTAREVLKYPVETVDYVELDPLVFRVAARLLPENLADPRIRVIQTDGRSYLKGAGATSDRTSYDLVLVDAPEPSTIQLNRFYTREFMALAATRLSADGVLCFALGGYNDYVGPEQARELASANRTARAVFANVELVPAGRIFFLASNGPLTFDIADRLEASGIPVRLMRREYLQAVLTPDRLADMRRAVEESVPVNRDFNPVLYYYHLMRWLKQHEVGFGLMEIAIIVVLAGYLFRLGAVPIIVFTGGFASATLEVMLLIGFQCVFGSTYLQVSLIVTMFMVGLGFGAMLVNRRLDRLKTRHLVWQQLALAVLAAVSPMLLVALTWLGTRGSVAENVAWAAFPVATLVVASLVGMQFPTAARVDFRSASATSSRLYVADYLGGALGALLVSTLLIPLLGVSGVAFLVAGACFLSVVTVMVRY